MTNAPQVSVKIDQVFIRRGEALTVWLDDREWDAPSARRVQVELKVTRDGRCIIYIDGTRDADGNINVDEKCIVRTHDEWVREP